MHRSDAWEFTKRALWIPIVYFGVKGCFDSTCAEAQEPYKTSLDDRTVNEYVLRNDEGRSIREMGGDITERLELYQR